MNEVIFLQMYIVQENVVELSSTSYQLRKLLFKVTPLKV